MPTVTYTAAHVLAPESTTLFNDLVCLLDLAFASDPVVNWLFKNYSSEKFLKKLTYYHRAILRLALLSGASVTVMREDNDSTSSISSQASNKFMGSKRKSSFKAMSILIPPSGNKTFDSTITHFRAGLLSCAWHAGLSPALRLLIEFVPKLNKLVSNMYPASNRHRRHDHWHLLVLAARPDCQGQGLGRNLMLDCQEVVREAAVKSKTSGEYVSPLYLESSTIGSKRLYNRMGFVDRGSMKYGTVREGETITIDDNEKVAGAQLFAMTWTP